MSTVLSVVLEGQQPRRLGWFCDYDRYVSPSPPTTPSPSISLRVHLHREWSSRCFKHSIDSSRLKSFGVRKFSLTMFERVWNSDISSSLMEIQVSGVCLSPGSSVSKSPVTHCKKRGNRENVFELWWRT